MMKRKILKFNIFAFLTLAIVSFNASAAMVLQMGLGDLVTNADKVFRGTVLSKEPGTVMAGGSEFSTIVYTLSVDDAIKGSYGDGKAAKVVTLTMLGNLKADTSTSNIKKFSALDLKINLVVGSDYVLFTTTPSSLGLSTTVGLDQGLFRIFDSAAGNDLTANGLGNQGIFEGAVSYQQLKAAIMTELN